ncbi:hypothetical protein E2C01_049902 [Portunus trituberculatus]|uniref:Uncharacterized protein n=1 Tax=Portunus trituberculatus TaxID=210409 RepID=A0A5B7GHD2_PORTR|nr:hypothetical protein [Portunus trituberculatus]
MRGDAFHELHHGLLTSPWQRLALPGAEYTYPSNAKGHTYRKTTNCYLNFPSRRKLSMAPLAEPPPPHRRAVKPRQSNTLQPPSLSGFRSIIPLYRETIQSSSRDVVCELALKTMI